MRFILFLLFIFLPGVLLGQGSSSSNELQFSAPTVVSNAPSKFTTEATEKLWMLVAREYETNPAPWTGDGLLMAARGFVMEEKYDAAIPVYKRFLAEEPTNALAVLELGKAYMLDHRDSDAIAEFKRGWGMGNDKALKDLAGLYAMSGRCSEIKPYVEALFKVRERFNDLTDKFETTDILVFYSLNGENPPNKALFLKAIDGLSDQVITSHAQTAQMVIDGLETFGLDDRAKKLGSELK